MIPNAVPGEREHRFHDQADQFQADPGIARELLCAAKSAGINKFPGRFCRIPVRAFVDIVKAGQVARLKTITGET
jgi:hypothetical protein